MSFQVKSSIPSDGYSFPAFAGEYVGALKNPPPRSLFPTDQFFLGRWKMEGVTLSSFKAIQIGKKDSLHFFGPVALANQFFLTAFNNSCRLQMLSFDAETLEAKESTPEYGSNVPVFLQSAHGLLFTPKDHCIVAYNPQLEPQFSIEISNFASQPQMTLTFTSDRIICANNPGLTGMLSTYDFNGQPTTDAMPTKEGSVVRFILAAEENLAFIGYYSYKTSHSTIQAWTLNPLESTSQEQNFPNTSLNYAMNTDGGIFLSSDKEVYSFSDSPSSISIQPFYTYTGSNPSLNWMTKMDAQTIVTVDEEIKIWKCT